ncbi:MAG: NADH-quinone oxidoreductase subunit M, partial [Geminicoccaceae bacterium]|nr:NADH-quinone oxidoreductase subunit M [Geminicoccaceae bacterium]
MLSLAVFLPALGMLAVILTPKDRVETMRLRALVAAGLTLLVVLGLWFSFDADHAGFQFVERAIWIETLGVGYAVGLDGMSLVLVLLTALLFLCTLIFSWEQTGRAKEYYAWFLFLETSCLGVFSALDLFLFYVFWDLTLVGMYFIIAIWGHEGARAAALKFFLYTFVGSIALLLGVIGLYLAGDPLTTDMMVLIEQRRLDGGGWLAHLVFWGVFIGLAVKTPIVPVHTWLPPAHGEAPAAGSAILAGVLLKMGTYGLLRILFQM